MTFLSILAVRVECMFGLVSLNIGMEFFRTVTNLTIMNRLNRGYHIEHRSWWIIISSRIIVDSCWSLNWNRGINWSIIVIISSNW